MNRLLLIGLGLAAAVLAGAALALEPFEAGSETMDAGEHIGVVALAAIWIVAGLIAWQRRPQNRVGALMTGFGFVELLRNVAWDAALPFTLLAFVSGLEIVLAVHLFLAFPSGRLTSRFERSLVVFSYSAWFVLSLLWQLVWDPQAPGECPDCPRNLLMLEPSPTAGDAIDIVGAVVVAAILPTTAVLVVRRVWRATGPTRRALAPVLLASAATILPFCVLLVLEGLGITGVGADVAGTMAFFGLAIIPLAFLAGLLQTRMHRSRVAELVVELGSLPAPREVRDAIARALGDPSLELGFWLPDRERYVDADGNALDPEPDPGCAVTVLEHDGERLAALVHDAALLDDPELVRAVGAAAALALENSRLQAELRAQLAEVRASRARILEAGDAERRRVERDLHDGAQQRLLGIRLALQLARGRLADNEAVDALAELRALARGIHPAILTEEGLPAALAALARRAPVPVELTASPDRLPAAVEATAYFVTAEALANVAKHAHASRATVEVTRANGSLAVEIVDDGIGGADPGADGLRGLRDRVEALDGRLGVESPPGEGTRITAAIPCA